MEVILEILTLIVCILLILIVLVQDAKGGGLSSTFGASNQILGVRRTNDFLEKATWVMAIALLVLSLVSASFVHSSSSASSSGDNSVTHQRAQDMTVPNTQPQQPQQNQQQQAPPSGNNTNSTANPPANNGGK